ncbi:MAG: aspartate carbamoyltransferase catalytic subunit [Intestinibacillus sp.]
MTSLKTCKDLLGLRELPAQSIRSILHSAETMKFVLSQPLKKAPHLMGKSVVELFVGESIRTKLSFELAAQYMTGTVSTISVEDATRERIRDVVTAIDHMGADVIILRHPLSGTPHMIAPLVHASIINAGDGINEQPTQALVDIFTIYQKMGRIEGLNIALIGDILHNPIAHSNIWGLLKLGANVRVAGPATLIPAGLGSMGVQVCHTLREALNDADVVMSMRLRSDTVDRGLVPDEREYARYFGLHEEDLTYAKPGVIVMHALPVRRGVDMSGAVISGPHSVIDEQVTNGVAIKMAVLYMFAKKGGFYGDPDSEGQSCQPKE